MNNNNNNKYNNNNNNNYRLQIGLKIEVIMIIDL